MKKLLIGIILCTVLSAILVIAVSLNLGRHSRVDFGIMNVKEIKTMGYYVKGYYEEEGIYYSICVEHSVEGEISDWIRLKLDDSQNQNIYPGQKCNGGQSKHWVGPEIEPTWIKNVFVTIKVPRDAVPGNYTATINNIACSPVVKKSGIGANICSSGPTEIEVEVV